MLCWLPFMKIEESAEKWVCESSHRRPQYGRQQAIFLLNGVGSLGTGTSRHVWLYVCGKILWWSGGTVPGHLVQLDLE